MLKTARARFYAFAFVTTLRQTGGFSWSTWLRFGLWLMVIILLVSRLWWAAAAVALVAIVLGWLYRRAKRNGYATFTALTRPPGLADIPLLPGHQKLPVRATGHFSVGEREKYVLLRPATCWHIPLDEHAIMVEAGPGSYLYQFIEPEFLDQVRIGTFLFGHDHYPGLEITFQTGWSPQISYEGIAYFVGGGFGGIKRLPRKIYLTFEDEAGCRLMWKSLVGR